MRWQAGTEENSDGSALLGPEEHKACGQEAQGAIWSFVTPLSKFRRTACAGLQPHREGSGPGLCKPQLALRILQQVGT